MLVVLNDGVDRATAPDITEMVRTAMRGQVKPELLPRRAWVISEMPTTGPGKTDRQRAAKILREMLQESTQKATPIGGLE